MTIKLYLYSPLVLIVAIKIYIIDDIYSILDILHSCPYYKYISFESEISQK